MRDFLQFLNSADTDSLTSLSGISSSLAEGIIAARPFDTIEDCLKVRGMGKNLLARVQASFEETITDIEREEMALIPVEQQPKEISNEKPQTTKDAPSIKTKPPFSTRLGQAVLWFFRALLRLILIILVIGGIGAAIYYGAPFLYEKFVTPVEQNATRVNELEDEIVSLKSQLAEIKGQLVDLSSQLNETNNHLGELEQSLQAHTTSLATLAEMQAVLEAQLKEDNDKALTALKNEIVMTRVLDTLARSRLYLAQSNFGLAKVDVLSARDLLAELHAVTKDDIHAQAIERLDMALNNLPEFPVVASGDLEIAWQILMTGEALPTETPAPTAATSPTPEPTLETTPTPTATP